MYHIGLQIEVSLSVRPGNACPIIVVTAVLG